MPGMASASGGSSSPFAKVERPPVLALSLNNIGKLDDQDRVADDLQNLWSVFTKCKGALQDGERLENLSWRLWYRQGPFMQEEDASWCSSEGDPSDEGHHHAVPVPASDRLHAQHHLLQPPSDPEDGGQWESDSSSSSGSEHEGENQQEQPSTSSLAPPAGIPMGVRSGPRSLNQQAQSSASAPTRPPMHHTLSFQKRKKHRSGSFQSAKHRSMTPVELQELLSTILPMRIPTTPSTAHSSGAQQQPASPSAPAPDQTPSAPAPAPLPVVTPPPQLPPSTTTSSNNAHKPQSDDNSSHRDSNSSIETRFSQDMPHRMSSSSDTSLEGLSSAALDRTPRAPMHELPEATEEEEPDGDDDDETNKATPRTDAGHHHHQNALNMSALNQQHRSRSSHDLSDSTQSRPGGLKRSTSLAANHHSHHHHQQHHAQHHHHHHHGKSVAAKRPALHRKAHSTKLSLSRNASAKNVRILEDTIVDPTDAPTATDLVRKRSKSRDRDPQSSDLRLSRNSSSSGSGLNRSSSTRSSVQNLTKLEASQPVPVAQPSRSSKSAAGASSSKASSSTTTVPTSSEPKSVVRGFEAPASLGTSPQPPPRVPFCSPAIGPPPRCKPAGGPPPIPPTPDVTHKPSPQPSPCASPSKRAATSAAAAAPPTNRRKFFLGAASASDSDEMARSPDHHHQPSYQSLSSRPSLPRQPSSLKQEQHFPQQLTSLPEPSTSSNPDEVADDADDSSGWGSDFTEDESGESLANNNNNKSDKGKGKATASSREPESMFIKRVPTAPGQLNRVESRTGLLTQLFKPSAEDVRAVDSILRSRESQAKLARNHSAVGLMSQHAAERPALSGKKSSASPAGKKLQQSKSAVALPVMSYERGDDFPAFEQQQRQPANHLAPPQRRRSSQQEPQPVQRPAVVPKTQPGRRLGGKPADVELSDDSDSDDDEDDGSGSNEGSKRSQHDDDVQLTPNKQAIFAAAMARQRGQMKLQEGGGAPEPIAFTPRTTRRSMLSTEMSESLRRNLLWERQSRNKLLGLAPAGQQQALHPRPTMNSGANSRTTTDLSGVQKPRSQPQMAPKTWQFSGGFHEHGW